MAKKYAHILRFAIFVLVCAIIAGITVFH